MIRGIIYRGEVFSYPVFDFVYPNLVKFAWRNHLYTDANENLVVLESCIEEFHSTLKSIIRDYLAEFYKQPDEIKLKSFPSRYERFELEGKSYFLDIATNPKDRIIFEVISLFKWIELKTIPHKPPSPENPE